MYDLTGFQRDVLYVVAGSDDPNGLGIKRALESYYEQEIHHSRLYPNLDALASKGLVEKGIQSRRSNVYVLTQRGYREITARHEWERNHIET